MKYKHFIDEYHECPCRIEDQKKHEAMLQEHCKDMIKSLSYAEWHGKVYTASTALQYEHNIHASLGETGLGGCLSAEEWFEQEIPEEPLERVVKVMLECFVVKEGYYPREFLLYSMCVAGTVYMYERMYDHLEK